MQFCAHDVARFAEGPVVRGARGGRVHRERGEARGEERRQNGAKPTRTRARAVRLSDQEIGALCEEWMGAAVNRGYILYLSNFMEGGRFASRWRELSTREVAAHDDITLSVITRPRKPGEPMPFQVAKRRFLAALTHSCECGEQYIWYPDLPNAVKRSIPQHQQMYRLLRTSLPPRFGNPATKETPVWMGLAMALAGACGAVPTRRQVARVICAAGRVAHSMGPLPVRDGVVGQEEMLDQALYDLTRDPEAACVRWKSAVDDQIRGPSSLTHSLGGSRIMTAGFAIRGKVVDVTMEVDAFADLIVLRLPSALGMSLPFNTIETDGIGVSFDICSFDLLHAASGYLAAANQRLQPQVRRNGLEQLLNPVHEETTVCRRFRMVASLILLQRLLRPKWQCPVTLDEYGENALVWDILRVLSMARVTRDTKTPLEAAEAILTALTATMNPDGRSPVVTRMPELTARAEERRIHRTLNEAFSWSGIERVEVDDDKLKTRKWAANLQPSGGTVPRALAFLLRTVIGVRASKRVDGRMILPRIKAPGPTTNRWSPYAILFSILFSNKTRVRSWRRFTPINDLFAIASPNDRDVRGVRLGAAYQPARTISPFSGIIGRRPMFGGLVIRGEERLQVYKPPLSGGETLGRGVYGSVSRRRTYGGYVALKRSINGTSGAVERLLIEACLLSQIESPHIPRVLDLFVDNGLTMVTECGKKDNAASVYIPGSANKTKSRRTLDDFVRDMYHLASALAHIHSRGVMHRDVKLENCVFMLPSKNKPQHLLLVDFGLACAFGANNPLRRTGRTVCTGEYRAPEVVFESREYGPPIDMWAFGVCLYFVMCNTLPVKEGKDRPPLGHQLISRIGRGHAGWDALRHLPACAAALRESPVPDNLLFTAKTAWRYRIQDGHKDLWKDLITALLNPDPSARPTALDVLNNPLFEGVKRIEHLPLSKTMQKAIEKNSGGERWPFALPPIDDESVALKFKTVAASLASCNVNRDSVVVRAARCLFTCTPSDLLKRITVEDLAVVLLGLAEDLFGARDAMSLRKKALATDENKKYYDSWLVLIRMIPFERVASLAMSRLGRSAFEDYATLRKAVWGAPN